MASLAKMRDLEGQIKAYARLKRHLLNYVDFIVLDFDDASARLFEKLKKQKIRSGTADLKIAAATIAHGGILLTRNFQHFSKVPGLRVEDWSRP